MELNEEIKSLRAKSKTTLSKIEEGGVNRMTYLRIEKGKNSPSVATLKKIARALGFEVKIKFIKHK